MSKIVKIKEGESVSQEVGRYRSMPDVYFAEPNYYYNELYFSDPKIVEQWSLDSVNATRVFPVSGFSKGQIVAVLDTGIDFNHPDLTGRILTGYDFVNNDGDPFDDRGHGTSVAGIISAVADNGVGIAGVAGLADVKILPVKVLDRDGYGTALDIAKGIRYAVQSGVQVINLSFGGDFKSFEIQDAINFAIQSGCLVIAAAGNDGKNEVSFPASISGVIAVSAMNKLTNRAYFSNYGPEVFLTAPGENIMTVLKGGNYGYVSGTSFSAPYVSGIASVLLGFKYQGTESLTQMLADSAADIGPAGKDNEFGYGLVNAYEAARRLGIKGFIQGKVSLQGTKNYSGVSVAVGNGERSGLTDNQGRFLIKEVEPGNYLVNIYKKNYLTSTYDISLNELSVAVIEDVELKAGDINGDGAINRQDLLLISSRYLSEEDSEVDFNGDGIVDIYDMVIAGKNIAVY